jgi:transcriptional regulator with XRE-family HTH domain
MDSVLVKKSILNEMVDEIDPIELDQVKHKMMLAAAIEDAMKAKGWRKQDLMKAMQIKSPSILSRWFSGTHNFTVDTLVAIQHVLEISIFDFPEQNPAKSK